MTPDRVALVDYIAVILPTTAKFIFREPPLSYVSNIYYLPFHHTVWFAIIISIVLCTFLIHLTYRYSMRGTDRQPTISDFALYAVSTVCQMGSLVKPKKLSGKIASVSSIFFFNLVNNFIHWRPFYFSALPYMSGRNRFPKLITPSLNPNPNLRREVGQFRRAQERWGSQRGEGGPLWTLQNPNLFSVP